MHNNYSDSIKIAEWDFIGNIKICDGQIYKRYKNGSFRAIYFSLRDNKWAKGLFKGRVYEDTGAFYA